MERMLEWDEWDGKQAGTEVKAKLTGSSVAEVPSTSVIRQHYHSN